MHFNKLILIMKKFYPSKIIIALLLFCFMFLSYSQEKVFHQNQDDLNRSSLTKEQQTKYNNMLNNPMNKSVKLVTIFDKYTLRSSTSLNFNFPEVDEIFIMNSKSIKTDPQAGIVWSGELEGDVHGTALIIAKDNAIYGQVNIENEVYMIEDLGNGKNVLIKLDESRYGPNECATPHHKIKNVIKPINKDKSKSHLTNQQKSSNNTKVRVLVLFTDRANNISNPYNMANLFINQSNQALQNSGITSTQLRFELAGVKRLSGFVENTNNIHGDVNKLRNTTSARVMRDNAQADLVMLLTDGNYHFNNVYGVVNDLLRQTAGNVEIAYGITEIDAAGGRFTFTHELAHLFGASHDNYTNSTFPYARGYNFKTGWWPFKKTRRTILNSLNSGDSRILHFSNPNVNYKNEATGTNTQDNARQLRSLATTVCDYRGYTAPPTVQVSGDFNLTYSEYGNQTYTAYASGGTAPYTYKWQLHGYSTTYNTGTNNTIETSIYPSTNNWSVKAIVTDANGATASSPTYPIQLLGYYKSNEAMNALDKDNIKLFPNPAKTNVELKIPLKQSTDITIKLMNFLGKTEKIIFSGKKPKGIHTFKENVSKHSEGLYHVVINIDGETIVKRLLIK